MKGQMRQGLAIDSMWEKKPKITLRLSMHVWENHGAMNQDKEPGRETGWDDEFDFDHVQLDVPMQHRLQVEMIHQQVCTLAQAWVMSLVSK